jgi:hypothetical protein
MKQYISTQELADRTGASYRQIDYWCRNDIFGPVGENTPGSGYRRRFDESEVRKVELLVRVSSVLGRITTLSLLKTVYNNYKDGFVDLGEGLILSWENEDSNV